MGARGSVEQPSPATPVLPEVQGKSRMKKKVEEKMAEKSPGSPSRMKKLEHLIQARIPQRQVSDSSSATVGRMSPISESAENAELERDVQEHQVHQHHPFGVPSEA